MSKYYVSGNEYVSLEGEKRVSTAGMRPMTEAATAPDAPAREALPGLRLRLSARTELSMRIPAETTKRSIAVTAC